MTREELRAKLEYLWNHGFSAEEDHEFGASYIDAQQRDRLIDQLLAAWDAQEAAEKVCEAARLWRLGRGAGLQGNLIAAIDEWLVAKGEKPDAES